MLGDKMHEIALLDQEIKELMGQLDGLSDFRQATIRKCREHIKDAIFILTEERLECMFLASEE